LQSFFRPLLARAASGYVASRRRERLWFRAWLDL